MITKTVDIIIPVYNVELYLRRCLDSIRKQTYKHWRAICVDDGSADGSLAILNAYAAADARFVVVHNPTNGGQSRARNQGLDLANAEFVMFVDSDDFIHPQTLELSLRLIARDGTDLVSWYRDSLYRNIQLKLLRMLKLDTVKAKPWRMPIRYNLRLVRSVVTDDVLKHASDWAHPKQKFALKHCYVYHLLIRRSLIKDIRFIEGLKYEDIPWWSEVLARPIRATITHLPLYYYYYNTASTSKTIDKVSRFAALLKGLEYAYKIYEQNGDADRMRLWSHNFKWAILVRGCKELATLGTDACAEDVKRHIACLAKTPFFADAATSVEVKAQKAYLAVAKLHEGSRLS